MRDEPLEKFFIFIAETGNEDAGIEPGGKDYCHPNVLGNVVMAKHFLQSVFEISFDPDKYLKDAGDGVMFPRY